MSLIAHTACIWIPLVPKNTLFQSIILHCFQVQALPATTYLRFPLNSNYIYSLQIHVVHVPMHLSCSHGACWSSEVSPSALLRQRCVVSGGEESVVDGLSVDGHPRRKRRERCDGRTEGDRSIGSPPHVVPLTFRGFVMLGMRGYIVSFAWGNGGDLCSLAQQLLS